MLRILCLASGDALIGRNLLLRHPVPTPRRGVDYPVVGFQLQYFFGGALNLPKIMGLAPI